MQAEKHILSGFAAGLRPEPILSVDEWADRHRYLSPSASAEPGRWRTKRVPYVREILQKLSSFDPTQEIVWKKSAQVAATETGNCWLGYIIHISPAPSLMVMPTEFTAKRNSKIRIEPMIESSPVLRERVKAARSRDSGNTILSKDFPGGVLLMAGANSGSGLRSMPIRNLFLDEVDAYPADVDGEGDPVDLSKARTRTFPNRKIFIISTPTIDGQSVIQREFDATDQRKYHIPCPHCGLLQSLVFENLVWEISVGDSGRRVVKPGSVGYTCEGCNELIRERYKTKMLDGGQWIATKPENSSWQKVGYHINSLYAPLGWFSWVEIAQQFEDCGDDVQKMKTFVNTVLGLEWKEDGEAPGWLGLYNRRDQYLTNEPPNDVAVITVGVDVQQDRLELEIVGWCNGMRTYSIDYRVLMGSTADAPVWAELGKVVAETWQRPDGVILPMTRMAVDTGYNTAKVYAFCRKYLPTQVIPVKGQDKQTVMLSTPRSVDRRGAKGKVVGALGLWSVGVSMAKSELYGWLKLERLEDGTTPTGYCHFPAAYDQHYFRMLTAEELRKTYLKGFTRYDWVKIYVRNESLDCRIYARAAAAMVGVDRWAPQHWQAVVNGYSRAEIKSPEAKKATKKRENSFWK